MDPTTIKLEAILRAESEMKTPLTTSKDYPIEPKAVPGPSSCSGRDNILGSWSPGKAKGLSCRMRS